MKVTYIEKENVPIGQKIRKSISSILTIIGHLVIIFVFFGYITTFLTLKISDTQSAIFEFYYANLIVSIIAVSREVLSKWTRASLKNCIFVLINLTIFNPFWPIYWGPAFSLFIMMYFVLSLRIYYEMLGMNERLN